MMLFFKFNFFSECRWLNNLRGIEKILLKFKRSVFRFVSFRKRFLGKVCKLFLLSDNIFKLINF